VSSLAGKVALVTGAGQGIGRACALALAAEGADVVVNDAVEDRLAAVVDAVRKAGVRALAAPANIADEAAVEAMVATAVGALGGLDILVNNAGIGRPLLVERMSKAEWDRIVDVNLGGTFNCARAVIRPLRARGGGRIVNISSLAGLRMSYFGGADYTASKAAVLGFTRHLAFELARDRITVNAICPGPTITPLVERAAQPGQLEELRRRLPLQELIRPEDIADAVLFFCSRGARMVTGAYLVVDGGASLGLDDPESYFRLRDR
jgi:NAD(P)-dependent dehydrogenase (short-subunit alcohol dehydrogenase family)